MTIYYVIHSLMQKDSLEITDDDRQIIHDAVAGDQASQILITHGTDTMVQTAETLRNITDKCIVLCGSMQPARMRESDASFNIGAAIMAVQCLGPGVYIVMNGQVFTAGQVRKNRQARRFEAVEE